MYWLNPVHQILKSPHPPIPHHLTPPTHTHKHTHSHTHTHTDRHTPCSQHLWETLFFTLWRLNKFSRICSTYFENNKLKNETRELATKVTTVKKWPFYTNHDWYKLIKTLPNIGNRYNELVTIGKLLLDINMRKFWPSEK